MGDQRHFDFSAFVFLELGSWAAILLSFCRGWHCGIVIPVEDGVKGFFVLSFQSSIRQHNQGFSILKFWVPVGMFFGSRSRGLVHETNIHICAVLVSAVGASCRSEPGSTPVGVPSPEAGNASRQRGFPRNNGTVLSPAGVTAWFNSLSHLVVNFRLLVSRPPVVRPLKPEPSCCKAFWRSFRGSSAQLQGQPKLSATFSTPPSVVWLDYPSLVNLSLRNDQRRARIMAQNKGPLNYYMRQTGAPLIGRFLGAPQGSVRLLRPLFVRFLSGSSVRV